MRFSFAALVASVLVVSEVSASAISRPNHAQLARRMARQRRCLQRATVSPADYHQQQTSTSSQVAAPAPTPDGNDGNNGNDGNTGNNGNTGSNNANTGGTIQAWSDACGSPNATPYPTATGGPNGSEDWLDCNIATTGWVPPPVTVQNLIYVSLGSAVNNPGSPFQSCAPYLSAFEYWAGVTGIPDILLASIALQESSCQPGAVGPNGEIGMMQITPDKCTGDCFDFWNNIGIGSQYFAGVVASQGGNLAAGMGMYNGWFAGMTVADANNHGSCGARNNLDYLSRVFNGFCQGIDPGSLNMGVYFNTNC